MRVASCIVLLCSSQAALIAGDCNQNAIDDRLDVDQGTSRDCNANLIPDECDIAVDRFGFSRSSQVDLATSTAFAELADMDADGLPDVVALEREAIQVVLLETGGKLRESWRTSIAVGSIRDPGHGAVADFDADGDLDLAAAAQGELLLLSNTGAGALELAAGIRASSDPSFVTAADLDGDARLDALTTSYRNAFSDSFSIHLNEGGFRFALARNFASSRIGGPAVAEDFDGDGAQDWALASTVAGVVRVYWNHGTGLQFQEWESAAVPRPEGVEYIRGALVAADVSQDGHLDLAVEWEMGWGTDTHLLLGRGRRAFDPPQRLSGTRLLTWGDLNADGAPELISARGDSWLELISLDPGLPEGHAATPISTRLGPVEVWPYSAKLQALRAADVDRDGDADIAGLYWYGYDRYGPDLPRGFEAAWVRFYLQRGTSDCNANGLPDGCEPDRDGSGSPDDCDPPVAPEPDCNQDGLADAPELEPRFDLDAPSRPTYVRPSNTQAVAVADFDRDADLDYVALGHNGGPGAKSLTYFENLGDRLFRPEPQSIAEAIGGFIVAELGADGAVDIVGRDAPHFTETWMQVRVWHNDGDARFTSWCARRVPRSDRDYRADLVADDFDSDGLIDIVLVNAAIWLVAGRVDGTIAPPERMTPEGEVVPPGVPATIDADGDGDRDLAFASGVLLLNGGRGELAARASFPGQPDHAGEWGVAAADCDGDGDTDLVTGHIAWNLGGGAFAIGPTLTTDPDHPLPRDWDSDGDVDILLRSARQIVTQQAPGVFATSLVLGPSDLSWLHEAADLDSDGWMDLLTGARRSPILTPRSHSIYWGEQGHRILERQVFHTELEGGIGLFDIADLDGDADRDLVGNYGFSVGANDGHGSFTLRKGPDLGRDDLLAAQDVDGDGSVELLQLGETSLATLHGFVWEGFRSRKAIGLDRTGFFPRESSRVTELNGDGELDALVILGSGANSIAQAALSVGREAMRLGPRSELPGTTLVEADDVDSDDDLDLLTLSRGSELSVFANDGSGGFTRAPEIAWKTVGKDRVVSLVAGDWDGDTRVDAAASICRKDACRDADECACDPVLVVLRNSGDGKFEVVDTHRLPYDAEALRRDDLDVDGDLDLLVPYSRLFIHDEEDTGTELHVLLGDGAGGFQSWGTVETGSFPITVLSDDLNADGLPDVVVESVLARHLSIFLNRTRPPQAEDANRNGLLDECEPRFRRGDANGDGRLDIADPVRLLQHLFSGGAAPECAPSGDANDDGALSLTDPVRLLTHLFLGAPRPPAPWPACGVDPTPDRLPCDAADMCP